MIERLFPLTKNKMEVLKEIYESGETHMLDISNRLGIHPYSVQKTLSSITPFLETVKSGRTITLKIDRKNRELIELLCLIEDYRVGSASKAARAAISNIQGFFSNKKNVLTLCLFGSYARGAPAKESDIDLLFVVTSGEDEILKSCRDISSVLGREISPLVMKESEFLAALSTREPTIETILKPSQRLLLVGKEYFLRNTVL